MKSSIKIPKQCYVGVVNDNNNKSIPTARISPYGKDPASKGRVDTINSWLKYCAARGMTASTVIDNEHLSGFRISDSIGSDAWLIEDPRGFEVEISATTLLNLLETTTVQNGEILEPCVWARQGPSNVLLSIQSQAYKVAMSNTAASEKKANWRDVKLGNKITLQNNICGTYLGKMHVVTYLKYGNHRSNDINYSEKNYYVILENSFPDNSKQEVLHLIAVPKLSSFDNSQEMSAQECEELANEKLHNPNCRFSCFSFYGSHIIALVNDLYQNIKINEIHIEYNSERDLKNDLITGRDAIFVLSGNKFGSISTYRTFSFMEHIYEDLPQGKLSRVPSCVNNNYQIYTFNSSSKFMNLEIEVSTKSGNIIKHVLK